MENSLQVILKDSGSEYYKLVDTALQYQQLMMLYESAMKSIVCRLDVLSREYEVCGKRALINNVKFRLKEPMSIADKLQRKKLDVSFSSMINNLNDIAGVRVICSYISDIYTVRDMLLAQDDITLIRETDYIKNPKSNGYRSLHLVIEIPVFLSSCVRKIKVEVQLRTIAMDFWASLEHQLRYKNAGKIPDEICYELLECAETISETDKKMERIAARINTA